MVSERAETLASQFAEANQRFVQTLEGLTDEQWRATTPEEGWTVAATAHHVASSHALILPLVKTVAGGQTVPSLDIQALHEGNAQRAKEHADVSRAEVIELALKYGSEVAAVVRTLSDEELGRATSDLFRPGDRWTTEQLVERLLIGHIEGHLASIRRAIG